MILCCGEALIDMIPEPTASGAQGFVPYAGGAIFNTAIALGRLGMPTGMLTGLSDDLFGQILRTGLEDSGVDTGTVITQSLPTTLAFVTLTDGHASYAFYDEHTAGRSFSAADLPAVPAQATALYMGGISLCSEPAADAYLALARAEAPKRAIMIDPNIRASFIADADIYRTRLNAMLACADIVKVSDVDLDWLVPGEAPIEARAIAMLEHGPKVVILTRGADGAEAWTRTGLHVRVAAQRREVVDTVAAGDTFNAGVLARLQARGCLTKAGIENIRAEDLKAALHYGTLVAGITVTRAGANPPWANEVEAP